MRALVQRVDWAEVQEGGQVVGKIGPGLLVYVGVGSSDTPAQAAWLARKVADLRIFEDEQGKLNLSVRDARGSVLAVSNFTLLADARKGRRPSFVAAAPAEQALPVHQAFLEALRQAGLPLASGVFGGSMQIRSQAAGPVNVIIDTPDDARGEQPC